jgi:hypothetical protein
MLTTREAADLARVIPATILAWKKAKRIAPAGHNGKGYLWEAAVITAHVGRVLDVERVAGVLNRRLTA